MRHSSLPSCGKEVASYVESNTSRVFSRAAMFSVMSASTQLESVQEKSTNKALQNENSRSNQYISKVPTVYKGLRFSERLLISETQLEAY